MIFSENRKLVQPFVDSVNVLLYQITMDVLFGLKVAHSHTGRGQRPHGTAKQPGPSVARSPADCKVPLCALTKMKSHHF